MLQSKSLLTCLVFFWPCVCSSVFCFILVSLQFLFAVHRLPFSCDASFCFSFIRVKWSCLTAPRSYADRLVLLIFCRYFRGIACMHSQRISIESERKIFKTLLRLALLFRILCLLVGRAAVSRFVSLSFSSHLRIAFGIPRL